jgi:hypothetical protein
MTGSANLARYGGEWYQCQKFAGKAFQLRVLLDNHDESPVIA